jgi:hypothetical protein
MNDLYGYRYSRSDRRGGSPVPVPVPAAPETEADEILFGRTFGKALEVPLLIAELGRGSMRQTLPDREEFRNRSGITSTGCEAGDGSDEDMEEEEGRRVIG